MRSSIGRRALSSLPRISDPQSADRLRRGELIVEKLTPPAGADLPGAMLHHWRGTAFAPGAKAADFERLMKDFNAYPQHFSPQVLQARVLAQQGDRLQATMRVRQRHVLTVVMDTAYDVTFGRLDAQHGYSISRSTQIDEIDSPGTAHERALSPGEEHGFLWRHEHLLELRGAGRRTLHADRVGLADAFHSHRPGLGGSAICGERSTRVAGVHIALHMQRAAQIARSTSDEMTTRKSTIGKETMMNAQATIRMNERSTATKNAAGFQTARRINQSLSASIEKRALLWMAERAPQWLSSDQLTLLGLGAQIAAGIFYALSRTNRYALLLVVLCIALNWLGDSMDGTLARVRRQQRPRYGFYVDHMVDIFGSVALMCRTRLLRSAALADGDRDADRVSPPLQRELPRHLYAVVLRAIAGHLRPHGDSHSADPRQLAALRSPYATLFGHRMLLFDLGGAIAAVCMSAMAISVTLRHTAAALPAGAAAMNTFARYWKFNLVGAMGMVVQLAALALFNRVSAGHYLYATAAAIELALVHNFVWHLHYTWRDRRDRAALLTQFIRFHLSSGLVSLLGNLLLMRILVHEAHIPLLVSNSIAILCCSIVNFCMGNHWAFAARTQAIHNKTAVLSRP